MMLKSFKHAKTQKRVCIDFSKVSHVFEDENGNSVIAFNDFRLITVTQKYESVARWWKKQQEEENDLDW